MADGGFWTALAAAVPGVGLAGMAIWKGYQEWRGAHPRASTWEQREARSLERARELLDRSSEAYLDRLERDNARLEAECDELRLDRDRGWNLARFWNGKAHDLRHDLNNALFKYGETERPPLLPGLEDPEPKPPTVP